MRRARSASVIAVLAVGALGVIASTQTWLVVALNGAAEQIIDVPGATAIPVLAPLSLAVLALGGALSIAGTVLRYVFGALALVLAAALTVLTWPVVIAPTTTHVAAAVTEATGIAGETAVSTLVATMTATPWPAISLVGWLILVAVALVILTSAHRWSGGDRRYRTEATATAGSARHDAIDDWDDLSRGQDPTTRPLD